MICLLRDDLMVQQQLPGGLDTVNDKMTKDFLTWDYTDATMLHGIGKYGSDPLIKNYKGT
jgi:hypothetical protein